MSVAETAAMEKPEPGSGIHCASKSYCTTAKAARRRIVNVWVAKTATEKTEPGSGIHCSSIRPGIHLSHKAEHRPNPA